MRSADTIPFPTRRPRYGREATSGDDYTGTFGEQDPNPNLRGPAWIEKAAEMVRTDGVLRALSTGLVHTLLSEKWGWRPRPSVANVPEAQRNAAIANEIWSRMSVPWEAQLEYLVRYALTGVRVGELVWRPMKLRTTGRWAVGLDRVADVHPSSYAQWHYEEDEETVRALEQFEAGIPFGLVGSSYNRMLGADKMVILTSGKEGRSPDGDGGLLRACFFSWFSKRHSLDVRGIGASRFGAPTVEVEYDLNVMMTQGRMTESEARQAVEDAYQSAQDWVSHGRGALKRCVGIRFNFIGHEFDPGGLNSAIESDNREMTTAFMLDWLINGATDTSSSYAFSQVAETFFRRWAVNVNQKIAEAMSGPARAGGGVIGRLFGYTWPKTDPELLPVLEHRGLNVRALLKMINALQGLRQSGFITPSDDIEKALRDEAGLDMPDSVRRTPAQRLADGVSSNEAPGPGRPGPDLSPEAA